MPYIMSNIKEALKTRSPVTPGELNYKLTLLCKEYWENHSNYLGINDIIGALEGCKLEFYRRVAAPYENQKIHDNGDVYN